MRIGVLSDTHLQVGQFIPQPVWEALDGVNMILHAGDSVVTEVLEDLKALAPVVAVRGNCDGWDLQHLPEREILELGGVQIGLTHGHIGSGRTTPDRAFSAFVGKPVDVIVFGHSHSPYQEWRNGILLFNPGSPTQKRREPRPSLGILELTAGEIKVEHIYLGDSDSHVPWK